MLGAKWFVCRIWSVALTYYNRNMGSERHPERGKLTPVLAIINSSYGMARE
jgi:hypothetical protein